MADLNLPVQTPGGAGGRALTYSTVANTSVPQLSTTDRFKFQNTGRTFVMVKKAAGTANITVTTPRTLDGLAVADRVVALAANADRLLGPFDPNVYNDGDGEVALSLSSAAAISIAVVEIDG